MKKFAYVVLTGAAALSLSGCVASMAVGVVGDVAEGAAKATVFTAKTAGKAAGAIIPGGDDEKEQE